jgi:hypothetical protein
MPKDKNEGIHARAWKREGSDANCRRVGSEKHSKFAVSTRRQTLEEERQCNAAVQLLLAEMVRQQLGCEGEK